MSFLEGLMMQHKSDWLRRQFAHAPVTHGTTWLKEGLRNSVDVIDMFVRQSILMCGLFVFNWVTLNRWCPALLLVIFLSACHMFLLLLCCSRKQCIRVGSYYSKVWYLFCFFVCALSVSRHLHLALWALDSCCWTSTPPSWSLPCIHQVKIPANYPLSLIFTHVTFSTQLTVLDVNHWELNVKGSSPAMNAVCIYIYNKYLCPPNQLCYYKFLRGQVRLGATILYGVFKHHKVNTPKKSTLHKLTNSCLNPWYAVIRSCRRRFWNR